MRWSVGQREGRGRWRNEVLEGVTAPRGGGGLGGRRKTGAVPRYPSA